MANIVCPFCGEMGRRSKEHVWAQWLRETPGGQALLTDSHGERIQNVRPALRRGEDGVYRDATETFGMFARDLPNVTVAVCASCNNGWMSKLEDSVAAILKPVLIDDARFVRLSADDLILLTTWATKSWMAYALTMGAQHNPFIEAEYRAMAADPCPLDWSRVWIFHAHEDRAHVGIAIWPTLLTGPTDLPDLDVTPDNTAFAYLAVSTLVMFMILTPTDLPRELLDTMVPAQLSMPGVRRSWPAPRRQYFPLDPMPDAEFARLLDAPAEILDVLGLPVAGRSDADLPGIRQRFLDGASPRDLRREHGTP